MSAASVPEAQAMKTLRLMSLALSVTLDVDSPPALLSAMARFLFSALCNTDAIEEDDRSHWAARTKLWRVVVLGAR